VGDLCFAFFICVGCIRAFIHTCLFDVDVVSFARFGFGVRKYGDIIAPGIQHKDRGTPSSSSSSSQFHRFPFHPASHPYRFDVNTPPTSSSHIRFVFFPVDPSTGQEKNYVNAFSLSPPISTLLLCFCSCPFFSCLRSISTTDANTDRSFCSLKSSMISGTTALLADAVQGREPVYSG